jgi:hypothetical protein
LSSIITYWQTFDGACSKHDPSNGSNIPKLAHETTKFKALTNLTPHP